MGRQMRQFVSVALVGVIALAVFWPTLGKATPGAAVDQRPSRGAGDVSPEVARKAAAISRQTMSPFCPGRTLSDCPSGYATEWRRDIREMVGRGMSAGEIQAVLESRVRGNLSGIPNRGSSYLFPVALALGAGVVLFLVFLRLGRRDSAEAGSEKGVKSTAKKAKLGATSDERLQAELDLED